MPITFNRSICYDLNETRSREWLITNGVGGYAAGTIAGVLTRMEQGLLVSSPLETTTPQLLVAKLDEEVVFDRRTYYLGTNEYRDGTLNPSGFVHLETFRLEEGFPIFTYRLGGIDGVILEKRIWMPQGQNTTCIQYRVLRNTTAQETAYIGNGYGHHFTYSEAAQREMTLALLPFSTYRPYNQPQSANNDWHFQVQQLSSEQEPNPLPKGVAGCTIRAWEGARPYHILAIGHAESQTSFIPTNVWYWNFMRRLDSAAGRPAIDDLCLPGVIRAKLWPAEDCVLTIVVTAEDLSAQTFQLNQLNLSYTRAVKSQHTLLQPQRYFGEGGEIARSLHILPMPPTSDSDSQSSGEDYLRMLLQAANRLVLQQYQPAGEPVAPFLAPEKVPVVLSDYYGMQTLTRDTLISLPGLLLATGRQREAGRILHWLARSFKQGLLPNHFPLTGPPTAANEYANVDTTLWFFYALDAYVRTTRDYELLRELYPRLAASIDWYIDGTENGISCDNNDGLLQANAPSKALTWMNVTVPERQGQPGQPVTPRSGKPVEVNALWYCALSLMHEWSQSQYHNGHSDHSPAYYEERRKLCRVSFQQKFWHTEADNRGYLYDVVDGPHGNDAALRPNQLLALSLRYPVLETQYRQPVFEQVTRHLLTPYGLRTLAPADPGYRGQMPESWEEQQQTLHQGSVWPWLIGPYIEAMLSMQDADNTPIPMRSTNSTQDTECILPHDYLWRKSLLLLEPFRQQLATGMLGTIGGVFSGNQPHEPGYSVSSVLSIGEILRMYHRLTQQRIQHPIDRMPVKSTR